MTAPTNNLNVAPGAIVTCAVTSATDSDHWRTAWSPNGDEADHINYDWTASGGSFSTPGYPSTSWTAPATPGTYTLTCTIDDDAIIPQGDLQGGSSTPFSTRTDSPVARTVNVVVMPPKVTVSSDRTAISAGGWNPTNGYRNSDILYPEPHMTTVTATVKDTAGNPLSGKEVVFSWDMPGPAQARTETKTTDANGKAAVKVVSGDELSKAVDDSGNVTYNVPVEVAAKVEEVEAKTVLDVVTPQDDWSPIEVSPDQNGDPTIRMTLTHDGLSVSGHPVNWGIDRIVDEDGHEVPANEYNDYVSISGKISTTTNDGMAAAYLRFGLRSGKVYYSARDGVVYRPAGEASSALAASTNNVATQSVLSGVAAGVQTTNSPNRLQQAYKKFRDHYTRFVVTTTDEKRRPPKILPNAVTGRLVVVHSTFSFRYEPSKNGERSSGLVRMQIKSDIYGDSPIEIVVPLDGKRRVWSSFAGKSVCLSQAAAAYYSTFARTLLGELWVANQPSQQLRTLSLVIEGYGAAAWDTVEGVLKLNPLVLPFTIYENRKDIGEVGSNAISLSINGVKFVLSNPLALSIVTRNPSAMPLAVQRVLSNPGAFRHKTFTLAKKAGEMMGKGFDDLIIYAANNPDGFKRGTGYVAGTVSIAAGAQYSAVTKVPLLKASSTVLGLMPIKTATTIVRVTKAANVLVNETNMTPLIGKALTKVLPKLSKAGVMTSEVETNAVIAASRSGWTSRFRVKLTPSVATAEAGTIRKYCFPAGTLIRMGDGTLRPIEEVTARAAVMSRDEKTGLNSVQKVLQVSSKQAPQTVKLTFSSGETIEATLDHPFYVSGKGFVAAKELTVGTAVSTLDGSPLQVQSIEYSNQAKTVYNFSVENTHSYFVGTSGVWVHNADVPCLLRSLLRVVNEPRFAAPNVVKNDIRTALLHECFLRRVVFMIVFFRLDSFAAFPVPSFG